MPRAEPSTSRWLLPQLGGCFKLHRQAPVRRREQRQRARSSAELGRSIETCHPSAFLGRPGRHFCGAAAVLMPGARGRAVLLPWQSAHILPTLFNWPNPTIAAVSFTVFSFLILCEGFGRIRWPDGSCFAA